MVMWAFEILASIVVCCGFDVQLESIGDSLAGQASVPDGRQTVSAPPRSPKALVPWLPVSALPLYFRPPASPVASPCSHFLRIVRLMLLLLCQGGCSEASPTPRRRSTSPALRSRRVCPDSATQRSPRVLLRASGCSCFWLLVLLA